MLCNRRLGFRRFFSSLWLAGEGPVYFDNCLNRAVKFAVAFALGALLSACGAGGGGGAPAVSILVPTSDPSYSTNWSDVRLGGAISHASFVHVTNTATGTTTEGFVTYFQGQGTWFADIYGLGFGENPITVIADADGTGATTASAHITVIRPSQPADLIFNGPNQSLASTFWTDGSSFGGSHKIALFADGTGRSTTGSVISETAGAVTDFTWTKLGPDSIQISSCPTCSFQKISLISGSLNDAVFYGQIETVGGAGELASHAFLLTAGNL
jgi:hypothetical protein